MQQHHLKERFGVTGLAGVRNSNVCCYGQPVESLDKEILAALVQALRLYLRSLKGQFRELLQTRRCRFSAIGYLVEQRSKIFSY
ncbi:hypothetical protein D9M71_646000 [compost metagenome]